MSFHPILFRKRPASLAVALACLVCHRAAADTNRYAGELWKFEDISPVLAAAASITPSNYPDCDDATVEKKMVRVYRADGTGECQDEAFVKVLTEKGKRANRTVSLNFMLPYFTVEVPKLEVIKPGGEVVPVDIAANSKETIDESQMQQNIYDPNMRVLQVNIPRVEIGDIVHTVTRENIARPIMPGEYAEESVFEGEGYIRHMSYEVHAPADRPLKRIVLRNEIPGTITSTNYPGADGTTVYNWQVSCVPRMFDEPAMPPYEQVLQRLIVSTSPDWATISKWYWDLSKSHLEATSPEMQKTVDDLTAGMTNDLDKIKAVFYHVSKKIRYMGLTPEKDRPGFEPHDVKLTFDKKYGVCRDKAALLVAMLRAAKLNAYPVLISVGLKRDPEVPDPFFNHAIVSVETGPGQYMLMDPTDENTRELLPFSDCDQSYLVCRPEGEQILISPIESPDKNMMRVRTTATLDANGSLHAKSQLSFEGVNDDVYRNSFSHMKPDDERRFFERNLKMAIPGARLISFKLTPEDMLDMSAGVKAELEFAVDGMTAAGSGKAMVTVPWIGNRLGILNFILGGTGLEKRKYPMQTYATCGLDEQVSLQLGKGFGGSLSLPSSAPIDDPCMNYQQHFNQKEQTLDCSRGLKLKVVEFSPDQYLTLKQALKELDYDERKTAVLAMDKNRPQEPAPAAAAGGPPPVESDAVLLDSQKSFTVTDAHNAVYRVKYSKRILNYGGKIREAELKVSFNPSCSEARLVHAVVVSPTGQRQEISKEEINIMDAGWNASAKRYTGGKILVANLPGVDIGSTIEVEFELTSKGAPYLAGFESFQLPDEVKHKSFELTVPAGLKVHTLESGSARALQKSTPSGPGQRYLWQARNVPALPAEAQLPPDWTYLNGVSFFIGDARDYLKTLDKTLRNRSEHSAKAGEMAQQLARKAGSPIATITAIRDFVAKSIRAAGPAFTDLPLNELSDADTTLTDGYGHLADRAILLHAMLRAAGFKPGFVLASDLPPINDIVGPSKSFPILQQAQSPLVKVAVGGQTYYLNDTDQYAKLGTTAHDGRLGIDLANRSSLVIEAARDCRDRAETDYSVSLGNDGKTRIGVVRRYYGGVYNGRNRYFSELPPEERNRYYQGVVSEMSQGARPVADLVTRFDTYPGIEQYQVEIDNYAVVDGNYLYFNLPFQPSLFPPGGDRRALPLLVSQRTENNVREEIQLPPGFGQVVIAPPSQKLDAPDGSGAARIVSGASGDKYVVSYQLNVQPAIVDPKDYPAMVRVESTLARKSAKVFLLEKEVAVAKDGDAAKP